MKWFKRKKKEVDPIGIYVRNPLEDLPPGSIFRYSPEDAPPELVTGNMVSADVVVKLESEIVRLEDMLKKTCETNQSLEMEWAKLKADNTLLHSENKTLQFELESWRKAAKLVGLRNL